MFWSKALSHLLLTAASLPNEACQPSQLAWFCLMSCMQLAKHGEETSQMRQFTAIPNNGHAGHSGSEGLCTGMQAAHCLGVRKIKAFGDSKLVVKQVGCSYLSSLWCTLLTALHMSMCKRACHSILHPAMKCPSAAADSPASMQMHLGVQPLVNMHSDRL